PGALDRVGVEVERGGVDVREHGPGALVDDRVRGRGEGERRGDRPVAGPEPRRPARAVERRGATRECDRVLHSRAPGQGPPEALESPYPRDQALDTSLAHRTDVPRIIRIGGRG